MCEIDTREYVVYYIYGKCNDAHNIKTEFTIQRYVFDFIHCFKLMVVGGAIINEHSSTFKSKLFR